MKKQTFKLFISKFCREFQDMRFRVYLKEHFLGGEDNFCRRYVYLIYAEDLGFPDLGLDKSWYFFCFGPEAARVYKGYYRSKGEFRKSHCFDFVPYLSWNCLLYTSPSPRDRQKSRMPSSA